MRERLHGSGPPQLLRAWALFVLSGIGFQKNSEHWQLVVPSGRAVPTVAFDAVQAAAGIGSLAALAGVALALPDFLGDLRSGGWTVLRRPISLAATATTLAAAALVWVALDRDIAAASLFVVFAVCSLFACTHAGALAAQRLNHRRAHTHLALVVVATMIVMTIAAAIWFAAVTPRAPSFVDATHLAVIATFMLAGNLVAVAGLRDLHA